MLFQSCPSTGRAVEQCAQHTSAPLLKSLSVAHPLQYRTSVQFYAHHLSKSQGLSWRSRLAIACLHLTQVWPLIALGDKIPLPLSLSLAFSRLVVGTAAMDMLLIVCVCVHVCACSLDFVYPPKSLPAWVWLFPAWDWGPLPWEGKEPQSCSF